MAIVLGSTMFATAQKHKVVSAFNYLNKSKLDQALESIEDAKDDVKTSQSAKTWFYRGNIYLAILKTDIEEYKGLAENPLEEAYVSYSKTLELDEKGKFVKDVNDRLKIVSAEYFNLGVSDYKAQKYESASKSFEKSANMSKEYKNMIDTTALYYAGNSADLGGDSERAFTFYNQVKDLQYNKVGVFTNLSRMYSTQGDTAKAIEVIQEGRVLFPEDFDVIITETNIYLAQGNTQKALDNLKIAVEKDATNPSIWFAVGTNYDKLMKKQDDPAIRAQMRDEAVTAYTEALNIDPNYYKPAFNLGALYVNEAAEIQKKANVLPLNATAEYDALKKEADGMLEKAAPMLEKAHELDPADQATMMSLKEIYARLNMPEKLKAISAKLQAAQAE